MRFTDWKQKEVINMRDGRKLGQLIDMEISGDGQIHAIIVPGTFSIAEFLKGGRGGWVIEWSCIVKVGDDIILVDIEDAYIPRE